MHGAKDDPYGEEGEKGRPRAFAIKPINGACPTADNGPSPKRDRSIVIIYQPVIQPRVPHETSNERTGICRRGFG
jgi:hypothetical protein